jgi:hypothetical protein
MLMKQDVMRILKALNLPHGEYNVGAGAALVIHVVKTETRDIDLGVTPTLFNKLA